MSINDLEEIIKRNNLELVGGKLIPEKTMAENGIDSLDITLISYEVANLVGKDIVINKGQTPNQILEIANA